MINSLGSAIAALSVASIFQSSGSGAATSVADAVGGGGDSASISGPGKLFSALNELASQNPTKFKEVAADIADKLKEAAQALTGGSTDSTGTTSSVGGPGGLLTDLAAKFEQAAQTGDVSGLQPPAHHGHRHHVGSYDQTGQATPPPPPLDSTSRVDLKSLFESVANEVTSALGA